MEILAQELVSTSAFSDLISYLAATLLIIGCFASMVIACLMLMDNTKAKTILITVISVIAVAVYGGIAVPRGIETYNSRAKEVMEYKAIIDDSVSFNEICDKYDVIEQDGKIITLRDKETKTGASK